MSEARGRGRPRDQRGVAVSSSLTLLSAAAVALAGAAFVVTSAAGPDQPRSERAVQASASVTASASASVEAAPRRVPARKPVVRRGETYVEIFNNSRIKGLAGSTAARAQGAGWQVVGSDNWYGAIDASTVYYPRQLRRAAELLAKDLGIARAEPIIDPMRGDRLTVILTADYS